MKTLLDLPDAQVDALTSISKREGRSRAAVIREAIAIYIASKKDDGIADAFGLWGNRKVDGLAYQRKMRAEW